MPQTPKGRLVFQRRISTPTAEAKESAGVLNLTKRSDKLLGERAVF